MPQLAHLFYKEKKLPDKAKVRSIQYRPLLPLSKEQSSTPNITYHQGQAETNGYRNLFILPSLSGLVNNHIPILIYSPSL